MKETYFFSHDYNARNDRKMVKLKLKLKMTGFGVYWSLVEMLYEEGGKVLLTDIEDISHELGVDPDLILSVIKDFNLFESDEIHFWSESILLRLEKRQEKSKKAALSAEKRWKDANALRPETKRNAIKDNKGKESKGKDIDDVEYTPPSPFFTIHEALSALDFSNSGFALHATRQTSKSIQTLETLREKFLEEQKNLSKLTWPSENDLKKHFINWVKKQIIPGTTYSGPKRDFVDHTKTAQNAAR